MCKRCEPLSLLVTECSAVLTLGEMSDADVSITHCISCLLLVAHWTMSFVAAVVEVTEPL